MNNFKKIIPKKSEKKIATSVKRNNSLKEENKKPINTERFYTTYEVFEKLNSNKNKNKIKKFRANSSSKKNKKSKIKNFSSSQNKKKLNFIDNNITNNTQYSTYETEYNKKKKKNSPKKKEFSNILIKAKELLSIQSDILIQCGKLNKSLSKNEIEIEAKLKNETNNNGTNILPSLAKALYLLELKKENNTNNESNKNIINDNDNINEKDNEKIDKNFYIKKFNELNGFIGELGYSYVYNEFFNENYKKENLIIYFDNIQKLISMLHQTVINQNEILIKQENQIKEYENIINEYEINNNKFQNSYITYNNKENLIPDINLMNSIPKSPSSIETNNYNKNKNKSNNHILIKENLYYNNINEIKENIKNNFNNNNNNIDIIDNNYSSNTNLYESNNSNNFYKNKEINNILKINSLNINKTKKESPKNTHYYNSYIEQIVVQG